MYKQTTYAKHFKCKVLGFQDESGQTFRRVSALFVQPRIWNRSWGANLKQQVKIYLREAMFEKSGTENEVMFVITHVFSIVDSLSESQ